MRDADRLASAFFSHGQVLPTHRLAHSPRHGGLFQPSMTQALRLLSRAPFDPRPPGGASDHGSSCTAAADPFSDGSLTYKSLTYKSLTYSTTGADCFAAPSAYASRQHAWVHVFPEGKTHQRADKTMRYFKWGVARLILEAEPCPDVVPMWIEGFDQVMHETRTWPRFLPRPGRAVVVVFGARVDSDAVFGDLRRRWRLLDATQAGPGPARARATGDLPDELRYGPDAVQLRIECAERVRREVLKLRRSRSLPDEDPKSGRAETWREEHAGAATTTNRREGQMGDGSWLKDV